MTIESNSQTSSPLAIFSAAVELTDEPARRAFIELACRGNDELRTQVQELLDADAREARSPLGEVQVRLSSEQRDNATTETFITNSPGEDTSASTPPLNVASQPQIGPYKIREQLGEGGMGHVYVAEQTEPVRRKVALKLIKLGMDTEEVVARFEAERQALAMMSHPNIAKVLDGGATETGRPYFVMELVRGVPITQFCDEQKLSTRERLELFLTVCQAVQHAHMKGIIHRDLKPSNVIVELDDVRPVPKVIDFGVAKATGQQLSNHTVYTQFAQLVGTPLYMSPEQAKLSSTDIDTRSDIYSLGVLLYELLTGTTPFDKSALSSVDATELRRIICEDDPPRPSARVSTLKNEQLTTISASRKNEPKRLSQSLQRELDWIVMKALEKDRERRYESANAFAADVQRYLSDEPVEACPPTVSYRLKKYAKKHKAWLTTAALLIVMLVTSTAVSGVFAYQANQERLASAASEQAALDAQAKAETERKKAVAAKELADRRLKQSQADVTRALESLEIVVEAVSSDDFGEIPAAQEIRKTTFEQAMNFYDAIIQEHDNSAEARMHQAIAHLQLKRIAESEGDTTARVQNLNAAIEILEALTAAYPDDQRFRSRLQKTHFMQIHVHQRTTLQKLTSAERALELHYQILEATEAKENSYSALLHLKVAGLLPLKSERAKREINESLRISNELGQKPLPDVHALAAQQALAEGDLDLAIDNYVKTSERFLEIAPSQPRPWVEIVWAQIHRRHVAELQERQRNFGDAEKSYKSAIEIVRPVAHKYSQMSWIRRELAKSLYGYVTLLDAQGRSQDADECFSRMVGEFPDFKELHEKNAVRLKDRDNPIELLTQAISTYPDFSPYYLARFESYAQDENWLAAQDDAETLFEQDEVQGIYGHYQTALVDLASEDIPEFISKCSGMLDKVSASDPAMDTHFTAWTCALAPDAVDDYEPAIKLAREALAKEPTNQQYLNGLGAILLRAGRYDEAKEQLEQALAAGESGKTSTSYIHYFLAMTEHHLENAEAAREQLAAANASADTELAGDPAWNRKLTLELLRKEAEMLITPAEDEDSEPPTPPRPDEGNNQSKSDN